MLDNAVKSPFNNGNGLGSGTYTGSKKKKKKKNKNNEDSNTGNGPFGNIFDELANVISEELKAMERSKRVNIDFDSQF